MCTVVWGCISVRWIEMCCNGCWVRTEGCRQWHDRHIRWVLDQAEAKLQRQQLSSQASILLQQAQDSALQHHVIGSPFLSGPLGCLVIFLPLVPIAVIFLLLLDELSFAACMTAVVFIAAATSFSFSAAEAVFAFEGKGATQEGSSQLACRGQYRNSLISEGPGSFTRSGPQSLHCQQ